MKSFLKAVLFSFLFISVPALTLSQGMAESAKQMLMDRDQEIKDLLGPKGSDYTDEQREYIKDIINDVIDYSAMAEHALQDTWNELTPGERQEFVDVFSTIVRDQSLNSLDIYRADVTYEDFTVEDDRVTARTIATLDNIRTPVIYIMVKRDDEWIVIDMSVDNVSTAESYRRSFQNIIRRRGYDALLANLKRRAGEA